MSNNVPNQTEMPETSVSASWADLLEMPVADMDTLQLSVFVVTTEKVTEKRGEAYARLVTVNRLGAKATSTRFTTVARAVTLAAMLDAGHFVTISDMTGRDPRKGDGEPSQDAVDAWLMARAVRKGLVEAWKKKHGETSETSKTSETSETNETNETNETSETSETNAKQALISALTGMRNAGFEREDILTFVTATLDAGATR